jgi:HlyD family secretion protein
VWSEVSTLRVPTSALFRRADGWAALVVSNGQAHERAVKIGHRGGALTEISEGLDAKERVIIHPSAAVQEGTRVLAR